MIYTKSKCLGVFFYDQSFSSKISCRVRKKLDSFRCISFYDSKIWSNRRFSFKSSREMYQMIVLRCTAYFLTFNYINPFSTNVPLLNS